MPANFSRPGDPDPSRSTHGVDLQDPDLLDSIVKDFADRREAGTSPSTFPGTGKPRYVRRNQTASFRSDAASDRADRLYIVNGHEAMCGAELARHASARKRQRGVCHRQYGIPANIASSTQL